MVTFGMNHRVLPGREQAFENMFRTVPAAIHDMPGHTGSSLFRDVIHP